MTATPIQYHDAMRQAVVDAARSWIGTPYHHAADVKSMPGVPGGIDCAMILVRVYCDLGLVPQVDPRPYAAQWHLHQREEKYLQWFTDYATRLPVGEAGRPGDVMLFKFGRTVSHSGIITAPGKMVHAALTQGCLEAEFNDEYMERLDSIWSVF